MSKPHQDRLTDVKCEACESQLMLSECQDSWLCPPCDKEMYEALKELECKWMEKVHVQDALQRKNNTPIDPDDVPF